MRPPLDLGPERLLRVDRERVAAIVLDAVPRVAPTLALTVWQAGSTLLELSAGWMDPETRRRPARRDAIFDLASITKTMTATLFLREVSAGRVGVDDRVADVIPELGAGGPRPVDGGQEPLTRRMLPTPVEREGWAADPGAVTFRHLLTHTSGLAPWRAVFEASGPMPAAPGTIDPVAPAVRHRAALGAVVAYPFVDRVGRAYHYSDLGFMLVGEAIHRLTGRSLDALIRTDVAGVLGASSLGFRPADGGVDGDRIVPTSVDALWRQRRCHGEVEDENCAGMGGIAGHAGLFANADDVARFAQAWLEGARRLGVDPGVAADATSDQTRRLGVARGLGWQLRGNRSADEDAAYLAPLGPGSFGHTGFTGTSLAIDPSRELVIVLLTNRVHESRTHPGIDELRRELHEAISIAVAPA